MAKSTGSKEEQRKLYTIIEGCIPDKYIDVEEEREIFNEADALNISRPQAEAMINNRCKKAKCTRETEVTWLLKVILEEMTKDDGVIDKGEFEHVIGFAVALRMPRKDAIRISIGIVNDNGWKTLKEGKIMKTDWFSELEENL